MSQPVACLSLTPHRLPDLVLSFAQYAIFVLSLVALGSLITLGRTPERVVGLVFTFAMFGTPLVDGLVIGDFRYGVAILDVGVFAVVLGLGLKEDRWWLLAAAGVQLLSLAVWVATLGESLSVWGAVTVRMITWCELMLLAIFGVLECRTAPYVRNPLQNG